MIVLVRHDFGLLENIGTLSYTELPNIDIFPRTIFYKSINITIHLIGNDAILYWKVSKSS